MAYDRALAERLREQLASVDGVTEKTMVGGLAFLVGGHLAVSASGRGGLLVRCDPARKHEHIAASGVERFEMRGRELDGWLPVDPAAVRTGRQLARWVAVGIRYAQAPPAGPAATDPAQPREPVKVLCRSWPVARTYAAGPV